MSHGHNKTTKKKKSWDVKESKEFGDDAPQQRVDLRPADFDNLIKQKGVNLKVYRTMYCPNVKSSDGAEHNIDCTLCNGSGFLDRNHVCCKGFIQNQELERMLNVPGGQHDGNSVLISFPIGIELQYFTLIELEDFTDIYYQRVTRNPVGLVDILKYKACRVNLVIDSNGVEYFQEQDFKIDQNGSIKWLNRAPAANVTYSIHYETHVQFRATRAMHVNRFTQYKAAGEAKVEHIKMPEQWLCTKEFLVRRKDLNGQDLREGPFSPHEDTTGENGYED